MTAQTEQREQELLLVKNRPSKESDNGTGDSGHSPFPPSFKPKLLTFNETKDDLDACLYRFEKHAEACGRQTIIVGNLSGFVVDWENLKYLPFVVFVLITGL